MKTLFMLLLIVSWPMALWCTFVFIASVVAWYRYTELQALLDKMRGVRVSFKFRYGIYALIFWAIVLAIHFGR